MAEVTPEVEPVEKPKRGRPRKVVEEKAPQNNDNVTFNLDIDPNDPRVDRSSQE